MDGLSYLPIGWNRRLNSTGTHGTTRNNDMVEIICAPIFLEKSFWSPQRHKAKNKKKKNQLKNCFTFECVYACVWASVVWVYEFDRWFQLMAFAILRVARARRTEWFALLFIFKMWRLGFDLHMNSAIQCVRKIWVEIAMRSMLYAKRRYIVLTHAKMLLGKISTDKKKKKFQTTFCILCDSWRLYWTRTLYLCFPFVKGNNMNCELC